MRLRFYVKRCRTKDYFQVLDALLSAAAKLNLVISILYGSIKKKYVKKLIDTDTEPDATSIDKETEEKKKFLRLCN
jgi:hypothetical protein